MNLTRHRWKKARTFFFGLGFLLCITIAFVIAKLQVVHAASYIYDVSDMQTYISDNGGSCEIVDDNTIKLTSDFSSENYMFISPKDSDLTLDMNSHSMIFKNSKGIAVYGSSYTFHIINSGENYSTAIISTTGNYANNQEICTLKISGKVKVSDVTLKNNATGGTENPLAVQQSVKGSELTMNRCRMESTGSCLSIIYGNASLINCIAVSDSNFPTILLENQGTMNINGGTYQNTGEEAAVKVVGEAIEGDAVLNIKDGIFKGVRQALAISGERAVVTISLGTFNVSNSAGIPINVLDKNSSLSYCYNSSIYTIVKTANTVKIVPKVETKKPVISKITVGKKRLKIKMSGKASFYGGQAYQVAYRIKGKKSWKYLNTTAQSKTIKALKKNKKYQIKVRAYRTINGVRYNSQWSKVKTSKKIKK